MNRTTGYVSSHFLRMVAEKVRDVKSRSYELVHSGEAIKVLDAGCGPGIDTTAMAACLPVGSEIVGVDLDPDMIREADELGKAKRVNDMVRHRVADIRKLPFQDAHFNVCRAERLFQNMADQVDCTLAFKELMRVLSPGGRMLLIDTDHGSASMDFNNLEMELRMKQVYATKFRPNGLAARTFYRMLHQAGMVDIHVETHVLTFTGDEAAFFGKYIAREGLENGYLDTAEALQWILMLEDGSHTANFLTTLNVYTVYGTKP